MESLLFCWLHPARRVGWSHHRGWKATRSDRWATLSDRVPPSTSESEDIGFAENERSSQRVRRILPCRRWESGLQHGSQASRLAYLAVMATHSSKQFDARSRNKSFSNYTRPSIRSYPIVLPIISFIIQYIKSFMGWQQMIFAVLWGKISQKVVFCCGRKRRSIAISKTKSKKGRFCARYESFSRTESWLH